jgi:hypothetical protein
MTSTLAGLLKGANPIANGKADTHGQQQSGRHQSQTAAWIHAISVFW